MKRLYPCLLCGESRYHALQCHRVVPGENGGKYRVGNVVVLCGNCHGLVTAGVVRIHSLHLSTSYPYVARVTDETGQERWLPMKPNGVIESSNVHP
jgi:HNH endonuclease